MRRNNLDISADILEVARGGAKKTHLVYRANLNFKLVNEYLDRLEEKGLIEPSSGMFYTTEKGARFLRHYGELASPRLGRGMGGRI